ncbi:MAG: glycosyltransferase family 2 protein [Eubacterium sp.]|nr:glycosyltransferase family 2 protein [Eubacterium sp.]
MKEEKKLSIITPTFNRGELLKKCYESLRAQTSLNFEWIIIDDGSSDNTEEIVSQFMAENNGFSIQFQKKENGGKHTALNESHKYITGDYVLILDSDDYLTEDAVSSVLSCWEKYKDSKHIGMIIFLKGFDCDTPVAYAKDEEKTVDILRYKRICKYGSDCCEVIRSELFLKYPFPVYDNEIFMPETVLWYRVGLECQCIYINKVVYICEYLEGGLTKSGRKLRILNPRGGMLNSELGMDRKNYMTLRLKNGLLFVCYGFFSDLSPKEIIEQSDRYRWIKIICLFPGNIMFRWWKRKYLKV